jgi:hypothetical protein
MENIRKELKSVEITDFEVMKTTILTEIDSVVDDTSQTSPNLSPEG